MKELCYSSCRYNCSSKYLQPFRFQKDCTVILLSNLVTVRLLHFCFLLLQMKHTIIQQLLPFRCYARLAAKYRNLLVGTAAVEVHRCTRRYLTLVCWIVGFLPFFFFLLQAQMVQQKQGQAFQWNSQEEVFTTFGFWSWFELGNIRNQMFSKILISNSKKMGKLLTQSNLVITKLHPTRK